ncbi:MAG: threonine synthase [Halocynthiibacter sp.]
MKYISTRGQAPELTFKQALLVGLADDGGLYVPQTWPTFTPDEIAAFRGKPYAHVAFEVMRRFVDGEIPDPALKAMIDEAYATFHHPAVTPLVQIGANEWLLELFHGPTMAFKDVAMQILARLMDYVLRQNDETLTIVGATSGDTGGAALAAFGDRENIDIFFMFPQGRVSPVQQRQMTTLSSANTHAIAIDGSFDDCQNMVKAMFANHSFRDSVRLSAVNSINWGRIMAQTVYYFTAAASLGAPDRAVSFTVPTGNFGDIYAGYVARQMGLPVGRLVIATNQNDILSRTLNSGRYEMQGVSPTITPSMDIQISSNFERLLFEACGRDCDVVRALMASLRQSGGYDLPEQIQAFIKSGFDVGTATQAETITMMNAVQAQNGYLLDPHSAVALHVAHQHRSDEMPMVVLSTAHPAKFPATVKKATNVHPALPAWTGNLMKDTEHFTVLENEQAAVEAFIQSKTDT